MVGCQYLNLYRFVFQLKRQRTTAAHSNLSSMANWSTIVQYGKQSGLDDTRVSLGVVWLIITIKMNRKAIVVLSIPDVVQVSQIRMITKDVY